MRTPLAARHQQAGAAFTDFAGWDMPLRYTSDLAEHRAVREQAGLFDLSHMGEIAVRGADAGAFLDAALSCPLSTIAIGRAKYTLLLTDEGGVIDDLIVYRLAESEYLVVANAANCETDVEALRARAAGYDVAVVDESDAWALIACQGPTSAAIVTGLAPGLDDLRYYRFRAGEIDGVPVLIARTGYTGEDGFEVFAPAADAVAVWDALVAAGSDHGLTLCGLACRDTLRLEAGMPLYGHELTRDTYPAQAGLERVAPQAPAPHDRPLLVGLAADGRRAGRAGYPVRDPEGRGVGTITSGALSPTLGHPVAMAYVDPGHAAVGTQLSIDVRGKDLPCRVVDLPFYTRKGQ